MERSLAVPDEVPAEVGVAPAEVAVEVGEQPDDKGEKPLPVILDAHLPGLVRVDRRRLGPETVGALDGAADPALIDDLEHVALDECGDLPVEGRRRDVGEPFAQLRGRQRVTTEKGLGNPQPNGVEEQFTRLHVDPPMGILRGLNPIIIRLDIDIKPENTAVMTTLEITRTQLRIHFTAFEHIAGLVRDVEVPLSAIRAVRVVDNGLAAARGLRAPGLGIPGYRMLGTWRTWSSKALVSVRRGEPALRIELSGQRWSTLLVGSPEAVRLGALIERAVGQARGGSPDDAAADAPRDAPRDAVRELPVEFRVGTDRLEGSLMVPAGEAPFPAALLIPGSGPVDRDSNHPRMPLEVTKQLAQALAEAGIASLRYDKRSVGASAEAGDWRRFGFHDRIDEARNGLAALRGRAEVDGHAVFVVGHSEGALDAAALAASDDQLAGVVLLSTSASPGEDVLVWQGEQIAPGLPAPIRLMLKVMRTDVVSKVKQNHAKIKATTTDVARIGGAKINARWMREFMAHDPRSDLSRITVPVLAITGSKDLQVNAADLDVVERHVQGPVETYVAPDVTHLLRRQPGTASLKAYKSEIRRPIDAEVTRRVTTWLRARTADPAAC